MKPFLIFLYFLSLTSATNYIVYAGLNASPGWEILKFFPEVLVVAPGDSVTFLAVSANHTATFVSNGINPGPFAVSNGTIVFNAWASNNATVPNGFNITGPNMNVSSGILVPGGRNFTVGIAAKPGTVLYYVCLLHPYMTGAIFVVNTSINATSPQTPSLTSLNTPSSNLTTSNMTAVASGIQVQLTYIRNTVNLLQFTKGVMNTVPASRSFGMNRIWTVRMVGEAYQKVQTTFNGFVPSNFSITVGDTVEFVLDDIRDQIVAFNNSFATIPPYLVGNQPNPLYFGNSSSVANYTGGFATSGLLQPPTLQAPFEGLPSQRPSSWNITFAITGSFPYNSPLHVASGMIGMITVISSPIFCESNTSANSSASASATSGASASATSGASASASASATSSASA